MGTGPNGGFGGAAPKKNFGDHALSLSHENVPFKTDYLKKMMCQGYAKCIHESRTLFLCYVLQVWLIPGRCSHLSSRQSLWERTSQKAKKIDYER